MTDNRLSREKENEILNERMLLALLTWLYVRAVQWVQGI